MGCDIHCRAERRHAGKWEEMPDIAPFVWRNYRIFSFLAGVTNYSAIQPISEPRGFPPDVREIDHETLEDMYWNDHHSHSWLSLDELLSFDYDLPMEDRCVTRQIGPSSWSHGCTCESGEGRMTTYREFLGSSFFDELERLKAAGAERIVFCFDN
jgi:hypothetical protein